MDTVVHIWIPVSCSYHSGCTSLDFLTCHDNHKRSQPCSVDVQRPVWSQSVQTVLKITSKSTSKERRGRAIPHIVMMKYTECNWITVKVQRINVYDAEVSMVLCEPESFILVFSPLSFYLLLLSPHHKTRTNLPKPTKVLGCLK